MVLQVAAAVLYRLGQDTGWPVPVGLLAVAGIWVARRRQRRRLMERR
jgi:MYXO-CTERM domain-containing protein